MPGPAPHGRFALRRCGGLLPPLRFVEKRIAGDGTGTTRVGPLPLPFRLSPHGDGYRLRYRFPLSLLHDELHRAADGSWDGDARLAGVRYGTFRMLPRE